ncbi:MAG: SDR family oxidoreductase [Sphingomonas sp.]|uniref:SDR family oxidoreductase n=1 Tax=Sphingomonas sp. TaxID=28214 RepID=UPI001B04401E|nr:SDR family oxidoreductase [Sphingomonas sp.]MBO9624009.1 SDR family oxidoreductase [Sphingomonas sp.]
MPELADPPARDLADAHTEQPSLAGRRALISGGTTGIGRAIAILLASEGARVFVCGRTPEHLDDALKRIREVGEGDGINIDLTRQEEIERFVSEAERYLGKIDIAVINAALPAETLEESEPDFIRYVMDTNLTAVVETAKLATERMEPGSDVVFIGSMSSVTQEAGSSVYVAAKTGMEGFAIALRKELAEKDIKVGIIQPGLTGTDMQYPEIPADKQREMIHQHKMLRAEDIAVATHYMLTQSRRSLVSMIHVEPRIAE